MIRPLMFATALLAATPAAAHGVWGHVQVTGWAIENLPDGPLKDFFSEPEVMNAALIGAAFPDTGYYPQSGERGDWARNYGEHAHWEPFIEDGLRLLEGSDFSSLEDRKQLAFLLGCAAHGLQDELFDSVMLNHIDHHEGLGQTDADPATDGFLYLDEHLRFRPTPYLPTAFLLQAFEGLDSPTDEALLEQGVSLMQSLYLNDGIGMNVLKGFAEQYPSQMPWTYANYLDPSVPGSLRAEILPTTAHLEALWARVHGEWSEDDLVAQQWPAPGHFFLSGAADHPGSMITLVYGTGVDPDTVEISWEDTDGNTIPHTIEGTRWGSQTGRLVRVRPTEDLPDAEGFVLTQRAGVRLTDGTVTTTESTLSFLGLCASEPCRLDDAPIGYLEPQPEPSQPSQPTAPPSSEGPEDEPKGCQSVPPPSSAWSLLGLAFLGLRRRNQRIR